MSKYICPRILTRECTRALADYLGCKMYYLHDETEDCHKGGEVCQPCVDITMYEICPEYYRCMQASTCPLATYHRKDDALIVHKQFQKDGVCPPCIPYIKPPSACPECWHPAHEEGGCPHIQEEYLEFGSFKKNSCYCGRTPADLQEKHCTWQDSVCFKEIHKGKCDGLSFSDGKPCRYWQPTSEMPLSFDWHCKFGDGQQDIRTCPMIYIHIKGYYPTEEALQYALSHLCPNLQPKPEMPLIALLLDDTEILAIKKSSNGDLIVAISQASKRQYDKDKKRLPAHDQQVRREFADKTSYTMSRILQHKKESWTSAEISAFKVGTLLQWESDKAYIKAEGGI